MAGRPRLPIGTFGEIKTNQVGAGRFRAYTRFRDWDGQTRQVTASGSSRSAAKTALKVELVDRLRVGGAGDSLTADSPFTVLAEAWLEDLQLDVDRSDGTKEVYERELRSLVLPVFEHFTSLRSGSLWEQMLDLLPHTDWLARVVVRPANVRGQRSAAGCPA